MIKFERGECPECLSAKNKDGVPNYERWNKSWTSKLKKKKTNARFSWNRYQNHAVNQLIAEKLRIMSNSHCAFCDKYAPEDDSDSIEHFFPKKKYPGQAFNWNNLFLSCGGCQKTPEGWRQYKDKHHLVLKPDAPDYSFDRYFIFDTSDGEVKVNMWNESELEREKAQLTIFYFQFNGFKRPESRMRFFKQYYDTTQNNNLKNSLELDELPYRFMYLN